MKLPRNISGEELAKLLKRFGYVLQDKPAVTLDYYPCISIMMI